MSNKSLFEKLFENQDLGVYELPFRFWDGDVNEGVKKVNVVFKRNISIIGNYTSSVANQQIYFPILIKVEKLRRGIITHINIQEICKDLLVFPKYQSPVAATANHFGLPITIQVAKSGIKGLFVPLA